MCEVLTLSVIAIFCGHLLCCYYACIGTMERLHMANQWNRTSFVVEHHDCVNTNLGYATIYNGVLRNGLQCVLIDHASWWSSIKWSKQNCLDQLLPTNSSMDI